MKYANDKLNQACGKVVKRCLNILLWHFLFVGLLVPVNIVKLSQRIRVPEVIKVHPARYGAGVFVHAGTRKQVLACSKT